MKLKAFPEVCNETMMALWEECKPCLKHTCMKFYARVCRSGSGLVGRQLEEFLNQSSPFYFWMNGDRIDSLLESDRQQSQVLDAMQDSFTRASGIIDTLFQDRFFTHEPQDIHHFSPMGFPHKRPHFLYPKSRLVRSLMPLSHYGPLSFHNMFQPFFDMIHQAQQAMDVQLHSPALQFPDVDFLKEGEDDRTVCKEIRHNSTGCLKMKGQCEKCQEILSVDCLTNNPAQANLRQELNDSLQVAERLTQQYNELLHSLQSKMLNTSSLLEQLNDQFSWVSQLANLTQGDDQYLRVSTVTTHSSDSEVPSRVTEVVVKLFDSDPITVVLPEEVSKDNPKFMDTVAEKALQEYRRKSRME